MVSPSRNSWWAMRADLVVERLEDQGVAGGFEVGGAEEVGGLGVGEGDVPAGLGVVLAVFVVPRGRRRRWRGRRAGRRRRGRRYRGRRAVRRPRSRRPWAGGGSGGRPGGPARPAPPTDTRFHSMGRRWRRSRASAISCAPADGDMPNANANGSGVNAATAGCRRRPVTRRPGGPPHRTSRPRCRRWRGAGRPSGRRAGACGTRRVVRLCSAVGGGFEHAGGVEVADLVLLPDRGAHGTKPSIDHRHSRPRIPCIHRGFRAS